MKRGNKSKLYDLLRIYNNNQYNKKNNFIIIQIWNLLISLFDF
jgi:ArsR family metal-binding transcriptional regulator